ncbi:MAG: hypothetical protein ACE364_12040 [Chlorobiota bacterium]
MNGIVCEMKQWFTMRCRLFILLLILSSCSSISTENIKIERIFSGYSKTVSNDTLYYPTHYELDKLYTRINLYDYLVVGDSVHLYFESLFSLKCSQISFKYSFLDLGGNKLKLKKVSFLPTTVGRFKEVLFLKDTILNIAIRSNTNEFAFASYKLNIN